MRNGEKVRVMKLTTERGFTWESLREFMVARTIGKVEGDATGALSWPVTIVAFGSEPWQTMQVPNELLQRVRP